MYLVVTTDSDKSSYTTTIVTYTLYGRCSTPPRLEVCCLSSYSSLYIGWINGCHWCIHVHTHMSHIDTASVAVTTETIWKLSLLTIPRLLAPQKLAMIAAAISANTSVPCVTGAGIMIWSTPRLTMRLYRTRYLRPIRGGYIIESVIVGAANRTKGDSQIY